MGLIVVPPWASRSGSVGVKIRRARALVKVPSLLVTQDGPHAGRTVVAATVLNLPLGSLYAFSVFLKPLEALLGVGRGDLALVFSLAALGFGAGTNLMPRVFGITSTARLVLACSLASAAGITIAATASGLPQLAIGYGVLFGGGGGG